MKHSTSIHIFQHDYMCVCVHHRDAVGSMGGVQCSFKVMQQLKNLAVSAFGHPSTWPEAQVTDLGNIIGEIITNNVNLLSVGM